MMMMKKKPVIHLSTINKVISEMGINVIMYKGDGYFYFVGDDVEYAENTMVCVYKLNELTIQQWLDALDNIVEDSRLRKEMMI